MVLSLVLLLVPENALEARRAFPDSYSASLQTERWHQHADWLRYMRRHRGHEDGRWDSWIKETEEYRAAWAVLAAAEADLNEQTMRQRLDAYRELVGDGRYFRRWHPPRCCHIEPVPQEEESRPWHQLAGANNP